MEGKIMSICHSLLFYIIYYRKINAAFSKIIKDYFTINIIAYNMSDIYLNA